MIRYFESIKNLPQPVTDPWHHMINKLRINKMRQNIN